MSVLQFKDFQTAEKDLTKLGFVFIIQDNALGHLYHKDGVNYRLVKNDFTGNYDFKRIYE